MSLKYRFLRASILMFFVPVLVILVMTGLMVAIAAFRYPTQVSALLRSDLGAGLQAFAPGGVLFDFVILWVVLALVVILVTCAVTVLSLSRSILPPLKELKRAAESISSGELGFEVMGSDVPELGALCTAFEDMRRRLGESVQLRLDYERERNLLLANISHDLRTPVTSIKGYTEGLIDGVAETPEMRERYLGTILTKANSMERLLEHMSDFSELELGRMRFHLTRCDGVQWLGALCEEYRVDFEAEGAELVVELPERPVMLLIDQNRLRNVFVNILSNALKYRAEERPLSVRLTAQVAEGGLHVSIADNGRGIPAEHLNRVFEGFYRADESRDTRIKGHGLGLAIAKQIVENHHGKIWIKSQGGEGTTVRVYLPEHREAPQPPGSRAPSDAHHKPRDR